MKKGLIVILIFCLVGMAGTLWVNSRVPKIAFVKSVVVLEKYHGMIEAKALLATHVSKWKVEIDSLKQELIKIDYQLKDAELTAREKSDLAVVYRNKKVEVNNHMAQIEALAAKEEENLTQGALNQINSSIKQYAEREGYDLIIGVTMSGNVLYGSDNVDVTEEIVSFLNANYLKNSNE